jgi:hypothetical protein
MLNGLELYKTKWHSGLTQQNHLAAAYLTEPQLIETLVTRMFGMQGANPIQYLTSGTGRKKELANRQYEWFLQGDDEKAIAITDAMGNDSGTPGKYKQTFQIKVAEKWFATDEVLVLDDRDYRVRIMTEPTFDGEGWILTLRNTSPDDNAFIDPKLLVAGKQLSKEYTTVSEFSTGGNTTFSTPFKMRNHCTTLRKSYTVTRSAATDVLVIQMSDPENPGKTSTMWTKYAEWEFMAQWYREVERSLWYSTFSENAVGMTEMMGENGLPVYEGAGIRQQIAPANTREYTKLSADIVKDFLLDLSYNVTPESSREFVAFTGEYGFKEFDDAMQASAKTWQLVDTHFVSGKGQDLVLGGQFKTYVGINGTKITLKHLPLYDHTVSQRQLHYLTGRPLESYRFTILDFGIQGGESNIEKVYKKDSEMILWHTAGSIDPYGNTPNSINALRSNGLDGYTVNMISEFGIRIKNPMACGELICTAAA